MSSKPPTPLIQRRYFPGENDTKIPQPSPQPFRRSVSLRLRTSKSYENNFQTISPTKPTHNQNFSSLRRGGSCLTKNSSKSFDTTDNCKHLSETAPNDSGAVPKIKKIDTNAPVIQQNQHGMSLNLTTDSSHLPTEKSPKSPHTPAGLPTGLPQKHTPKTPPVTPDFTIGFPDDDDLDSLHSFSSVASGGSRMSCDHPYVARNGTTFSGRKMKYVVHCSSYAGQTGEDYLTPTQRAHRHVRRLKEMLAKARIDLEQKDSEILRLTKEVVELRLFKASLNSPEERSNSSDAVTVRENNDMLTSTDVSPIVDMIEDGLKLSPRHQLHINQQQHINQNQFMDKMNTSEMGSSFADSGHFEDITTSSINSKDSYIQTKDQACGANIDDEKQELVEIYEKRIDELIRQNDADSSEMKKCHNDRVEALLQKLAECNTRYSDLVPDYEQAKEKIRELERQLEALQHKLEDQEDKSNKMYLHMYTKGQEAERIQHSDRVLNFASQAPSRVSVPELLEQLQVTQNELENIRDVSYQPANRSSEVLLSAKEAVSLWLLGARKTMYKRLSDAQQSRNKVDPEVTLQFLKSAIYYFLTDKENSQGHLNAIESILGFSDLEKINIEKARSNK